MLPIRTLQRYILIELLRVFAFVLSALTVLLVFVGVFQQVSESGLGPAQILPILPYVVPSLLPFTIPATLLLTVCVVYGRLAGDNEITAAKAAGINVLSLFWPSFFLGAVLSVGSLMLTDQVIPWSVGNIQRIVTLAMENIFLDRLRTHNQMSDPQHGFTVTVIGVQGKKLIMPYFRYAPSGHEEVTVQAREATLEFDVENQQVILHLVDGHIDIPGERRARFDKLDKPFPLSQKNREPKARHINIRELRKKLDTIARRQHEIIGRRDIEAALTLAMGDFDRFSQPDFTSYETLLANDISDSVKLRTEMHGRFALSCSCFFFVLLGCPYSILQARRQFLTSFFMVFVPILLIYYPVILLMMNLSKTGTVNPAWAMWAGNAILLAAACVTLRRAMQH